MSDYDYDDDEIEEKAEELEAAKKITEEACIAYLCGDHDQYWEAMRRAAKHVLSGYTPHFLNRSEIKKLMEIYGEPKEDVDETDYAPPPAPTLPAPPPPPDSTSILMSLPDPNLDPQKFNEELERRTEELAKKLEAEGKFTEDAFDFYLWGARDLYWNAMKLAAIQIINEQPVKFLSPEEMQAKRQAYNQPPPPPIDTQYNYTSPTSEPGCLETFFTFISMGLAMIFVPLFFIIKWSLLIGSGLIIPYLIYKAIRYFMKQ